MASDSDFHLFTSLRYDPQLLSSPVNTTLSGYFSVNDSPPPSPFYMLAYHRDRILEAADHFNWKSVVSLLSGTAGLQTFKQAIVSEVDMTCQTPSRVRIALDREGNFSVTCGPTPSKTLGALYPTILPPPEKQQRLSGEMEMKDEKQLPETDQPWEVVVDCGRSEKSDFSTYKTSKRAIYDSARSRAGIESFAEPKEVLLVNPKGEIMEGSLTSIILWRGERWVTPPCGRGDGNSGGQKGTTRRWLREVGLVREEIVRVETLEDGEECWLSNGVRGVIYGKIKL